MVDASTQKQLSKCRLSLLTADVAFARWTICKQTFLALVNWIYFSVRQVHTSKMSIETEYFQEICRYCLASLDANEATECLSNVLADQHLAFIIETCIEPKVSSAPIRRYTWAFNLIFLVAKCCSGITTKDLRRMHGHITRHQRIPHQVQKVIGIHQRSARERQMPIENLYGQRCKFANGTNDTN